MRARVYLYRVFEVVLGNASFGWSGLSLLQFGLAGKHREGIGLLFAYRRVSIDVRGLLKRLKPGAFLSALPKKAALTLGRQQWLALCIVEHLILVVGLRPTLNSL